MVLPKMLRSLSIAMEGNFEDAEGQGSLTCLETEAIKSAWDLLGGNKKASHDSMQWSGRHLASVTELSTHSLMM